LFEAFATTDVTYDKGLIVAFTIVDGQPNSAVAVDIDAMAWLLKSANITLKINIVNFFFTFVSSLSL
jgi:hypothetical protein